MPIENVPEFIKNNAQRGLDYLAEGLVAMDLLMLLKEKQERWQQAISLITK